MRRVLFLLTLLTAAPCASAVETGQPAPAFTGTPLAGGQALSLESLRGKVVYLDFWASWCGPCRLSLPWMENLRWPLMCFVAVAFWNMLGAGVFGFMINPPISLYYIQGLNTTPVHAHAALFGVYGFLALGFTLLVLRYLSGFSGTSLTADATGATATRNTGAIEAYLNQFKPTLDVDGNGESDALTDGLLIARYLSGLRGSALIAGVVGQGAGRSTAARIEDYLKTLTP